MSDHNANDKYFDSADAARDEMARDPDALRDQDLDQAAGGYARAKTGGDAAADAFAKNDKPESDRMAY